MKLAILDKDGTLVLPKSNNTFVQNPTDQILMVGAVEGCQRLIEAGYVLAIAMKIVWRLKLLGLAFWMLMSGEKE
jgi:histidinol phosphatase-like enzyme